MSTQTSAKLKLMRRTKDDVKSCAGGLHNMPRPCKLTVDLFDLESDVGVTCDAGYLCANFSLHRPLFST